MYIDILLVLAFSMSAYFLWQRISKKIPELTLIPDQDLSILLEQNTEKFQRFLLHVFHFRLFYRERHYHEKARLLIAKMLYRLHIAILRLDNRMILVIKRIRMKNEMGVQQENTQQEYMLPIEKQAQALEKINRVQEVRSRKHMSFANVNVLGEGKIKATHAMLVDDQTLLP